MEREFVSILSLLLRMEQRLLPVLSLQDGVCFNPLPPVEEGATHRSPIRCPRGEGFNPLPPVEEGATISP